MDYIYGLLGLLLLIAPIIIAFKVCGWRYITAFIVAIFGVPAAVILGSAIYEALIHSGEFDLKEILGFSAILGIAGLPIYFLLVIPVYFGLKRLSFPVMYSFPLSLIAIMLAFFLLISDQPMGIDVVLIISGCSLLHAFFILWLIKVIHKTFPKKSANSA